MPARPVAKPQPQKRRQSPDIRTGTPDPIHGFTKQPHEYEHLVTGGKLSGLLQSNLIYWIGRRTWGETLRPEWAKLSLAALAKLCGGFERKSVALALADLIARGIIEARGREGCTAGTAKMYKLTPANWKKAAPYVAKPEGDEEIEEAEPDTDEEEAADDPQDSQESTLPPGRTSRPQRLSIAFKGAPSPVELRLVYHSEFDQPLTFRSRAGQNGRVQVTVSKAGEHEAKRCSHGQLQSFAKHSPSTEENKRVNNFTTCISSLMLDLWGKAADAKFTAEVIAAAGTAAPELFERLARERLKRGQGKHTPGLLVAIAGDAARTAAQLAALAARLPPPGNMQGSHGFDDYKGPLDQGKRWDRIRAHLRKTVSEVVYSNWFILSRQLDEGPAETIVSVPTRHIAEFMRIELSDVIHRAAKEIGEPGKIVWRFDQ